LIDLHCHILPGIDDGPGDLETALEMARVAVAAGTTTIVATPHVSHEYPNTAWDIHAAVRRLNDDLTRAGIDLEVLTGGEVTIPMALELPDDELDALHLGGGPYLLVEAPLNSGGGHIEPMLDALLERGHGIVLAHPERSPIFIRQPERLSALTAGSVLCQITAGSMTGQFGGTVQRLTMSLLASGLVHDVASDGHDPIRRPPTIGDAFDEAERHLPGLGRQLDWYAVRAPEAILHGEALPLRLPLPAAPRRRTGLQGLLRRS
jgi:protein-tyrosine phosphatase